MDQTGREKLLVFSFLPAAGAGFTGMKASCTIFFCSATI